MKYRLEHVESREDCEGKVYQIENSKPGTSLGKVDCGELQVNGCNKDKQSEVVNDCEPMYRIQTNGKELFVD